ncbi:hypothetical protein GCM10028824_21920 [Hymenobacter segetis]
MAEYTAPDQNIPVAADASPARGLRGDGHARPGAAPDGAARWAGTKQGTPWGALLWFYNYLEIARYPRIISI